jgi:hypothetical protein
VKKVFGIVLALALVLTAAVASAVPAGAVTEGTVNVCIDNPIAGKVSNYCISFHNGSLLKGADGDFIDVMFPYGTDASGATVITVQKSPIPPPAPALWCAPCACTNSTAWAWTGVTTVVVTPQAAAGFVRLVLDPGEIIEKCYYVFINIADVQNPTSCEHHLQVGTSTHTPVASNTYTIYCAKIELKGGVDPITGFAKMNLISLPCYPLDTSIEEVLADLFLMKTITAGESNPFTFSVWYWDNTAKKWYKYASDTSFTDLQTIEAGKAYWIKPSRDIDIYIHGTYYIAGQGPPVKWCYPFSWSMVGFACNEAKLASEYLAAAKIPPMYIWAVLAIWTWDPTPPGHYAPTAWDPTTSPITDATLTPGVGYWMAFLGEACIIPPADCDC